VEEQLAEALQPFGDLVAIGQPGERLPLPGAARIYASEEEWKEVVSRQMRAARLVVIRAGVGENLFWELKQAVETLKSAKSADSRLEYEGKALPILLQGGEPAIGRVPSGGGDSPALWASLGFHWFYHRLEAQFFPASSPILQEDRLEALPGPLQVRAQTRF
jgi:hypothetical protein